MSSDTDVSKSRKVKTKLHSDEFDVVLAAISNVAIVYRQ